MNAPLNFAAMAKRDPAIACLMGAIAGYDFGYSMPSAPAPYRPAPPPSYGFGDDDMGYGYGDDYGYGYGRARHPAHPAHHAHAHKPPHPHAQHHAHHGPGASTEARTLLLDPNRHSTVKVERYSFSFSPAANLVLGTASAIQTFTQQPSASIKPQRVLMNAPQEGFVFVSTLQIANVNVFIGGTEDAFSYGARAQGVVLDLPRLDPQNRATSAGNYSGVLPPGFTAGAAFTFIVTLQGPATLAGGFGQ